MRFELDTSRICHGVHLLHSYSNKWFKTYVTVYYYYHHYQSLIAVRFSSHGKTCITDTVTPLLGNTRSGGKGMCSFRVVFGVL
jgi:hypothetical protein